jgi:hypothetical protein
MLMSGYQLEDWMTDQRRLTKLSVTLVTVAAIAVALSACTAGSTRAPSLAASAASAQSHSGAASALAQNQDPAVTAPPRTPPARMCGNNSVLRGPATMPRGAIRVPAGNNASFDFTIRGKTFWFAPGVHTLGTGEFNNIDPADADTYVGAPGAILDGQQRNDSAFDGSATHVVIEYLTIRNFGAWGGDQQEGVVNHDSASYWTITHSTIIGNAGAGVMLGSHDVLSWSCLQNNQQYGFNAYSNNGKIVDIWLDHNEIIDNDTYNYEVRFNGCGCSGGGKFWNVVNARVTSNWVVNNKSVGLWADTDNAGFEFVGNYIQNSQEVGLQYEISYNALIEFNTFEHNGVAGGPANSGFPTSAIYISESGSDNRVNTNYKRQFLIAHNNFVNNWGGVILWENSNRFCGSPDNSSTGYCTMADPKATLKTCSTPATVKKQPYFDDCRWKTQNILVEDNAFTFSPSAIGKACTVANNCGYNGVFSEYGSDPSWSPYMGDVVPTNIALRQNNRFLDNTYSGPWCFMGWQLGTSIGFDQWRATANVANAQFGQDAGSTHTGASRACS